MQGRLIVPARKNVLGQRIRNPDHADSGVAVLHQPELIHHVRDQSAYSASRHSPAHLGGNLRGEQTRRPLNQQRLLIIRYRCRDTVEQNSVRLDASHDFAALLGVDERDQGMIQQAPQRGFDPVGGQRRLLQHRGRRRPRTGAQQRQRNRVGAPAGEQAEQ